MDEIQRLCTTIDQLVGDKIWDEALEAAVELWRISRDAEIAKRELRLTYARTLIKVADLFYYKADDPYETTRVLRRAYELAEAALSHARLTGPALKLCRDLQRRWSKALAVRVPSRHTSPLAMHDVSARASARTSTA